MKTREKIFSMYRQFATEKWQKMPWQDQGEHARQYQIGYAKAKHLDLEIVRDPGRANIAMVLIPPGRFLMGSPENEPGRYEDEKQHIAVITRPYYMGKTPVTQAQWEAVMGSNPSNFKGADLPVETVRWEECQSFCQKTGLFLPTEAEWEFACRAGTQSAYYFGNDSGSLGNYAWYDGNSDVVKGFFFTHPVAQKQPNAYGLYDMAGNVYEWIRTLRWWESCYQEGYYLAPQRGGSHMDNARKCRAASRREQPIWAAQRFDGFRVCLPL